MHGFSRMTILTLASLECDGARLVFTDQADIAWTKRKAPRYIGASRMKGELHPTKNHLQRRPCIWMTASDWGRGGGVLTCCLP